MGVLKPATATTGDTRYDVNLCVHQDECTDLYTTNENSYIPGNFNGITLPAPGTSSPDINYVARDVGSIKCTTQTLDNEVVQFMVDDVWRIIMACVYSAAAVSGVLASWGLVELFKYLAHVYDW